MALQASGSISASQIRNEFAGVTQVSFSISQYFRHAEPTNGLEDFSVTYTSANNSGVSTSGAIKFSDFYSKYREVMFKVGSVNVIENANTSDLFSTYWTTNVPKKLINNGTIGATGITTAALTVSANIRNTLVIDNIGSIQGAGGAAGIASVAENVRNGGDGGTAILLNSLCSINNTGTIYGGGGGGGAGTKGGTGGNGSNGSYQQGNGFGPSYLYSASTGGCTGCPDGYRNDGCFELDLKPKVYQTYCGAPVYTTVNTTGGTGGTGGDGGNGGVGAGYGQTATTAPALDTTGGPVTAPALNTTGGPTSGGGGSATAGSVGGNGGIGGNGVGFGSTGGNGTQGVYGTNGYLGGTPVGAGGAAGYYLYFSRNLSGILQGTTAGRIEN